MLLFVIRDHIGVTPLANLQTTLTADLTRIWESLAKPAELTDRQLSDYFDLAFTALPHKILAADKFEEEVQKLRTRFVNKSSEDYLFKPVYHKRIPADGVAFYMEGIWVSRVFSALLCSSQHLVPRTKSNLTRTSIYLRSRSCWRSSDVTKFQPLHFQNSTSRRSLKNGQWNPVVSSKVSVR